MNRFWIILTAVIIGLGVLFVVTKEDTPNTTTFTGDAKQVQSDDHVIKAPNEKVVLIEYGDFQCPACAATFGPVKEALEQYKDQVTFVFRHLPLTQIHPNAFAAARAAEAASNQGKFWEMHDKLFQTQTIWGNTSANQQSLFESYAEDLKLDMTKFKADYVSEAVASRINRDAATAKSPFNITGTPSFVLNGNKIDTPAPTVDAFKQLFGDAVAKAQEKK